MSDYLDNRSDEETWLCFLDYLEFFDKCLHIVARTPEVLELMLLRFFEEVLVGLLQDRLLES